MGEGTQLVEGARAIAQFLFDHRNELAHLIDATLVTAAVGLLARGSARYSWAFFAYLLATATYSTLITLWPERFLAFDLYFQKETVLVALKILVAVEIWWWTFSSFPRARVRVGLLLVAALASVAAAAQTVPQDLHPYDLLIGVVLPRLQAGLVLLYAIVMCATTWYRVPVHPFHRALLLGFAAWLTVDALLLSLVGWHRGAASTYLWVAPLKAVAYLLTAFWWCGAAWRPAPAPSPVLAKVQPWAHSW